MINSPEKLLRYCDRPPFAMSRLHETTGNDDSLAYQLKKPLPDGTAVILLKPLELIDRIAKLMSTPYSHRHRYFGVLASSSPLRSQVIAMVGQRHDDFNAIRQNEKTPKDSNADDNQKPTEDSDNDAKQKTAEDNIVNNDKTDDVNQEPAEDKKLKRPLSCCLWAELLAIIFGMPGCSNCGKSMRVISFFHYPDRLCLPEKYILSNYGDI